MTFLKKMENSRLTNLVKKIWLKLLFFFAVLGSGIITAVADNDAGGVATYTVGAALYGMNSQFLIIPITILLAVTQEIGSRIAIVAKKGLGDLIRERYGVVVSLIIFIIYFITNQGVVLQNLSGLKSTLMLFNLPYQPLLIIISILLILLITTFDYKKLQQIFLFMILFYFAYIFSAIKSNPNWLEGLRQSLLYPDKKYWFDLRYWFANIAILGTTITAWGQFFVHSYIIDKKLDVQHLKAERLEIAIGAFITNFFSWMIALAVTYTLYVRNIKVEDAYSAALAMKPLAGEFAALLFGFGLFGASLLGLTIVPLATAYVFSEMFGYEGSLDRDFRKSKIFYSIFILQIVIGLIITLFPQTSLFKLTLYVDFLNGAMLPLIFYFLIKFSEDKEIMGEKYISHGFSSVFLRICAIVITFAVAVIFIGKFIGLA